MATEILKLGGIYKTEWDDRPYRVIGFDKIEVFYDCLWPHDNSWTFSGNFNRKCYFYRTSSKLFAEKSTLLEVLPLSDEEQIVFRSDLPHRICRTKELCWNDFTQSTYKNFKLKAIETLDKSFLGQKLLTDKIILIPCGNQGGLKKGTVLTANNSTYFECTELIWKAKELQEAVNTEISNGIGIYRMGFQQRLPSFKIGEYIDAAGLLKEYEL